MSDLEIYMVYVCDGRLQCGGAARAASKSHFRAPTIGNGLVLVCVFMISLEVVSGLRAIH